MVLDAVVVLVVACAWTVWERRRRAGGPERAADEARYGGRLVVGWVAVLGVLVGGLLLRAGGVAVGGWLALGAVAAMVLLVYVVPWLGPRRARRGR